MWRGAKRHFSFYCAANSSLIDGSPSCSLAAGPAPWRTPPPGAVSPASGYRGCRHAGGCYRTTRSRTDPCRNRVPRPGRGRYRPASGRAGGGAPALRVPPGLACRVRGCSNRAGGSGAPLASVRLAPRAMARPALRPVAPAAHWPVAGRRIGWRGRFAVARLRGAPTPISRPRAARASNTRSSAMARRIPRCRWARIVDKRPVPKQAATALKSGLAERCGAVSASWRP